MEYYRRTETPAFMSDWGHAMFSSSEDKIEGYGEHLFTIDIPDGTAVHVTDKKFVKAARRFYARHCYDQILDVASCYGCSKKEALNMLISDLNPKNIVDSAGFWDTDAICLFWEKVLEPNEWAAIETHDGCVVFDKNIIA